jgi:predicted RNase H-related nuclease YkuK (DUF458 family)
MFDDEQIEDMVELLSVLDKSTKIYVGCDSIRYVKDGIQFARYATVAIVHMNGKNGCRVFKNITRERDYDANEKRPKLRLMNEVMKVCELYNQIYPYVDEYDIEIHLDINTDPKHNSSNVAQQAAGYVLGVTGIQPRLKPDSWAASFGADGVVRGFDERKTRYDR